MNLSIQLVSGTAPGRIKFLLSDNGLGATIDSYATRSPTIQGHPNAAGAVAVAAAMYYQTPACGTAPAVLEPYSSYGDDPILFDTNGHALATPLNRNKPDLTGPDAVNDTFLGFRLAASSANSPPWNANGQFPTSIAQCQNNTQYPNFFGTSAAAPHAAAAAEVPKKFGYCVLFWHCAIEVGNSPLGFQGGDVKLLIDSWNPRNVLLIPSGPVRSGLLRFTGVARATPLVSNRIGSPP